MQRLSSAPSTRFQPAAAFHAYRARSPPRPRVDAFWLWSAPMARQPFETPIRDDAAPETLPLCERPGKSSCVPGRSIPSRRPLLPASSTTSVSTPDGGARAFERLDDDAIYRAAFTVRRRAAGTSGAEGFRRRRRQSQACRIGFDLGASDYKVRGKGRRSPLQRRVPLESLGPGHPTTTTPTSHGSRRSAKHLPRVEGIGRSTAGSW